MKTLRLYKNTAAQPVKVWEQIQGLDALVLMGRRKYKGEDEGEVAGVQGGQRCRGREGDGRTSRRSKLKITWKSCR